MMNSQTTNAENSRGEQKLLQVQVTISLREAPKKKKPREITVDVFYD